MILLIPALLVFGGWGVLHAIGAAICSSYNFISNDFCDRWHYDPPPEDAVPLPEGWTVGKTELSCGSGGCPTRMYVLEAGFTVAGNTAPVYVRALESQGWNLQSSGGSKRKVYRGQKDGLDISIEAATEDHWLSLPREMTSGQHVVVGVSLVDN